MCEGKATVMACKHELISYGLRWAEDDKQCEEDKRHRDCAIREAKTRKQCENIQTSQRDAQIVGKFNVLKLEDLTWAGNLYKRTSPEIIWRARDEEEGQA
jgi:hypothetical protein